MVGFGISLGAQFVGTAESTAVNGALITTSSPAFIVLFAVLILHEKLTPRRVAAILLASIGVLIIINPAEAEFSSSTFIGDVFLALAGITWGLYSVLVRRVSQHMDTLTITFWAFIGGLLLIIPTASLELTQNEIGTIDAGIIAGVLYLGVISTAVAMWLWNRAFALVDASTASLFFFAQPLVGSVLGVVLLGQAFTPLMMVGAVLIIGGVMLALLRERNV
jgi:drug/metabolite transporter (DMT)-like permease